MTFISMENISKKAYEKGFAIPQFNVNSPVWLESILDVVEENDETVIIAFTDRIVDQLGGFKYLHDLTKLMVKHRGIKLPLVLHLDHGQSIERCKQAIDAGFSSVMFDGSKMLINENISSTREVVNYAKNFGVSVEAEVGAIGGTEDGIRANVEYASVDECIKLYHETGITTLAAALGSVHGEYSGEPNLQFEIMKTIKSKYSIPLVLHGASGISDEDIKKAVSFGHVKINYNTELNKAFSYGLRNLLIEDRKIYNPAEVLNAGKNQMKNIIRKKIRLLKGEN